MTQEEKRETLDDIVADMRDLAEGGAVLLPPNADDIREWADRIDAAAAELKREIATLNEVAVNLQRSRAKVLEQLETVTQCNGLGNAAKCRDALVAMFEFWSAHGHAYSVQVAPVRESEEVVAAQLDAVMEQAKAALAAPPRNCERFATVDEAKTAFYEGGGCPGDCGDCPYDEERSGWHCEVAWLLDTATPTVGVDLGSGPSYAVKTEVAGGQVVAVTQKTGGAP